MGTCSDQDHLLQDETEQDPNPYKSEKWNTARADPDHQANIPIAIHYAKIILKILFAIFVLLLNLRQGCLFDRQQLQAVKRCIN